MILDPEKCRALAAQCREDDERMTGQGWRYYADLAWLSAQDPDGEIYTIANLSLDSTSDGKCYGASRNGTAIARTRNSLGAIAEQLTAAAKLAERCAALEVERNMLQTVLAQTIAERDTAREDANPGEVRLATRQRICDAINARGSR